MLRLDFFSELGRSVYLACTHCLCRHPSCRVGQGLLGFAVSYRLFVFDMTSNVLGSLTALLLGVGVVSSTGI